jgi:hypothetical protein
MVEECGCNSVVECQLPKLNVAGSSPVTRFQSRVEKSPAISLRPFSYLLVEGH